MVVPSFVVHNYCYVPPGMKTMSHVSFGFKLYFYFVNTPLFQWRWWPYCHYLWHCKGKLLSRNMTTKIFSSSLYTGQLQHVLCNFHICTMHPAIIKVFYYQLMHKRIVFKGVLKFTLKLQ